MKQSPQSSLPLRAAAGTAAASLALMLLPLGAASAATQAPEPASDSVAATGLADASPSSDAPAVVASTEGAESPAADEQPAEESAPATGEASDDAAQEPAAGPADAEADAGEEAFGTDAPAGPLAGVEAVESAAVASAVPLESAAADGSLTPEQREILIQEILAATPGATREHLESLTDEDWADLIDIVSVLAEDYSDQDPETQAEMLLSDEWLLYLDLVLGPHAADEFNDLVLDLIETLDGSKLVAWLVKNLGTDDAETVEVVQALIGFFEDSGPEASETASTEQPTTADPVVAVSTSARPTAQAEGEQLANTGAAAWGPAGLGLAGLAAGGLLIGLRRIRLAPRKH